MESKTFEVPNIGCAGCVKAIENELGDLEGISKVKGEVDTKMVTVEYAAPMTWPKIVEVLTEIDYAPAEA